MTRAKPLRLGFFTRLLDRADGAERYRLAIAQIVHAESCGFDAAWIGDIGFVVPHSAVCGMIAPSQDGLFGRLVDVLLPSGGCVLAWVEAYFDESIAHVGAPILCVAGYLIGSEDAKRLSAEWTRALAKRGLPYFRMSACAHGNKPFDRLSRDDRVALGRSMIECIKRRTILGLAVSVNLADFERLMPQHPLIGTPYTFCAQVIIGGVANWIREQRYEGKVAYFFEAGHASGPEADGLMRKIFHDPELKLSCRYGGHSFVEKIEAPPVQAADLLAWQSYTDLRHQSENRPRRKDFESLLRRPHKTVHVSPDRILHLARAWYPDADATDSLRRLHLGDRLA